MKTSKHILKAGNLFLELYNDKNLNVDEKLHILNSIDTLLIVSTLAVSDFITTGEHKEKILTAIELHKLEIEETKHA